MTELSLIKGDITVMTADAIVNAANSTLMGGGGVDGAIHRAGGPSILEECRAIVAKQGGCNPGEAVITGGGTLPTRFVIHTVGPIWSGRQPEQDDETLASCYRNSLALALANNAPTIAFPNVSTGVYGFPKARAAAVAIAAVRLWLVDNQVVDEVTFVCFDDENLAEYAALL